MKKLYTLLATVLCGSAAFAQSFNVTWNGTEVKEGETVTIEAEVEDYFGDGTLVFVEAKSNPTVSTGLLINKLVGSDIDFSVVAKVQSSTVQTYALQMCCGGDCMRAMNGTVTKNFNTSKVMGDKDHIPFQYDLDFSTEGNYGTVKTVVEMSAAGTSLKFYVNFVYSEGASVTAATANNFFRLVEGGVNYSFSTSAPRKLSVYSVDGKLLQNAQLAQRGTIHFNALPAGVYVLEVKEKGRKAFSKKVYIY